MGSRTGPGKKTEAFVLVGQLFVNGQMGRELLRLLGLQLISGLWFVCECFSSQMFRPPWQLDWTWRVCRTAGRDMRAESQIYMFHPMSGTCVFITWHLPEKLSHGCPTFGIAVTVLGRFIIQIIKRAKQDKTMNTLQCILNHKYNLRKMAP